MSAAGARAAEVLSFALSDAAARARYDALFAACPGAFIQQSTWWAEAVAPLGPDEPVFLLASDDSGDVGGLPLYVFRAEPGALVTSVPQAGPLGGPFLKPGLADERAEAAWAALLRAADALARERGALALTLITSPFADDLERYERLLAPDLVLENFTQWIPLTDPPREKDGLPATVAGDKAKSIRSNLRKSEAAGVTVSEGRSDAEFDAWYDVHRRGHEALGAAPLPRELLAGLRRVLEPRGKARLLLAKKDGRIVAGTLYVWHEDVLDVFIASTDPDFAELAPGYQCTRAALELARRDGVKIFNWQSSPSRASGVYRLKEKWGSRESPYRFVTKLYAGREPFRALGPEGLRKRYPGHFALPHGALSSDERRFAKP